MKRFYKWLSDINKEASTNALVRFLARIIFIILSFSLLIGFSQLSTTPVTTCIIVFLIISIFAIRNILFSKNKWNQASINKKTSKITTPKNKELDDLTLSLLSQLREIERVNLNYRAFKDLYKFTELKSYTLYRFDIWENHIFKLLKEDDRKKLTNLRAEISGNNFRNARSSALEWVQKIKELANTAKGK